MSKINKIIVGFTYYKDNIKVWVFLCLSKLSTEGGVVSGGITGAPPFYFKAKISMNYIRIVHFNEKTMVFNLCIS